MHRADAFVMVLARAGWAWAVVGLTGCCVVALLSLVTPLPPLPFATGVVFAVMAPGSFFVIVAGEFETRRHEARVGAEFRTLLGWAVPAWLTWWTAALGAFLLFNLAWSATHLAGSPEMAGARYVLDNHGVITTTTRREYQRAERLQLRLVTSIPGIFHLAALTNMRRLARARVRATLPERW